VLNIIQRRPAECVFIDDREETVAAARRLGIRGVRLDTPAQAIAELGRLGVAAPAGE
jgi:FMN phosphatase YigB (HAD superfamily)